MLRIIARLKRIAFSMPRRSPLSSVMPALSIATSVPVPIAMPTSAAASAGASLIPSPAIATTFALLAQLADALVFVLRFDARFDFIDAELLGDGARGALVVAGEHDDFQSELVQMLDRVAAVDSLIGSATARMPAAWPSIATNITVLPCSCSFAALASSASRPATPARSQKCRLADQDALPSTRPTNAAAGRRLKVGNRRRLDAALARAVHDRGRERMFAVLLRRPQRREATPARN